MNADPLLRDFALAAGSALIDVGTDLSALTFPDGVAFTTDIAGTTRGATWDVGVFEVAAASGLTFAATDAQGTQADATGGFRTMAATVTDNLNA